MEVIAAKKKARGAWLVKVECWYDEDGRGAEGH